MPHCKKNAASHFGRKKLKPSFRSGAPPKFSLPHSFFKKWPKKLMINCLALLHVYVELPCESLFTMIIIIIQKSARISFLCDRFIHVAS